MDAKRHRQTEHKNNKFLNTFRLISLIKLDDDESERYAKVLISAVKFFVNDKEALLWLKTPVKALGGRLLINMLSTDKDVEIVLNVIGRLEHSILTKLFRLFCCNTNDYLISISFIRRLGAQSVYGLHVFYNMTFHKH